MSKNEQNKRFAHSILKKEYTISDQLCIMLQRPFSALDQEPKNLMVVPSFPAKD